MSAVQKSTDAAHTLPGPYKISVSNDGDTISISKSGSKSVSVKASSMEGIKNVLSKFWPTGSERLTSNSEMILLDQFSGESAKLTLGSFADVAKLVEGLLLDESVTSSTASPSPKTGRRGRPPKAEAAAKSETAKAKSAEPVKRGRGRPRKDASSEPAVTTTPVVATTEEAPKKRRGRPPKNAAVATSASAKPKKSDQEAKAVTGAKRGRGRPRKNPDQVAQPVAETTQAAPRRGRPPKAQSASTASQAPSSSVASASLLGSAPTWFGADFLPVYEGKTVPGDAFSLTKVPLKLAMPGSKKVSGVAVTLQDVNGWGYEIKFGRVHSAWIIVSGPTTMHIVSDDGSQAIPQKSIAEVMTTITTKTPKREAARKVA